MRFEVKARCKHSTLRFRCDEVVLTWWDFVEGRCDIRGFFFVLCGVRGLMRFKGLQLLSSMIKEFEVVDCAVEEDELQGMFPRIMVDVGVREDSFDIFESACSSEKWDKRLC